MAREIEHLIGASHTFSKGLERGEGFGLTDYTLEKQWDGVMQFHPAHESEMCTVLLSINQREHSDMVDRVARVALSHMSSLPIANALGFKVSSQDARWKQVPA